MTKNVLFQKVDDWDEFDEGTLSGTSDIPANGKGLKGPARVLFESEIEHQTLGYIVYSTGVPILWFGAFNWIMPTGDYLDGDVSNDDYFFALEIADELS